MDSSKKDLRFVILDGSSGEGTNKMNAAPIRIVAFDARYVNDCYQGIGRHAYNLLEALSRLDPSARRL